MSAFTCFLYTLAAMSAFTCFLYTLAAMSAFTCFLYTLAAMFVFTCFLYTLAAVSALQLQCEQALKVKGSLNVLTELGKAHGTCAVHT